MLPTPRAVVADEESTPKRAAPHDVALVAKNDGVDCLGGCDGGE